MLSCMYEGFDKFADKSAYIIIFLIILYHLSMLNDQFRSNFQHNAADSFKVAWKIPNGRKNLQNNVKSGWWILEFSPRSSVNCEDYGLSRPRNIAWK